VRRVEDERLLGLIRELHRRNYFAYGSWRMWKALLRAGGVSETLCTRVSFGVLVGLGSGCGRRRGIRTSLPSGVSSCSRGF
jgi:hypothetical protein